jgi:hypothetical protein
MKNDPLDTLYKGSHIDEVSLLNYSLRDLQPDEEKLIETHLRQCDLCLMKVQEFVFIQSELNSGPDMKVPLELVEKVQEWEVPDCEESSADSIPRLIIRLAADGIKLLKGSVLPKNAEVKWMAVPQYALRGDEEDGEESEMIYKESIKEKKISIHIFIRKDTRESLQATILLKEYSNPIQNIRVSLKRDGRIVRSKKTNSEGIAIFTELHSGEYNIQIPSENIEWAVSIVL